MLFVAAILPVVIYIFIVYKIDNFSLISVKNLFMQVLCGMVAALVCFGLFQLTGSILSENQSEFFNPVWEEIVKALPLLWLATRKKIVFFIDSVICGAAVGGGFSILENLFYLLLGNEMGIGTVLFRGLEVALIHMGCSAIIAAGLMLAVRIIERSHSRLSIKKSDIGMSIFLLLEAPVLHVFHNTFLLNPFLQFIFVFGTMGGLLVWTYYYDVDMIHRWIDKGLDKQLALLDSIKSGQLDNTQTGIFLESIKEKFSPEDFFDIICYVQLHVELSVAAKSRVMIRESGLVKDLPLTKENKALILSQYEEYKLLEQRLGKAARMTVAPIVKYYPADFKALEDLRTECQMSSDYPELG
ncbi:PrsW family glutamic-type intramembrane protease [Prevotella sp. P6B4]|uniref:PrsW family glutamic-type intramembrane protease n=1 Tax=Prevotella sp. P6B4 TaxID=1410614 RepID=UPI0004916D89|nr:PrsW family glutamic-type intramembrane protease [Prevotella sp. P6B4]